MLPNIFFTHQEASWQHESAITFRLTIRECSRHHAVELCDEIRVSLDGPEMIHNKIRGIENAYSRMKQSMSELNKLQSDYPIFSRCVIHKQNYTYLPQTVETSKWQTNCKS